MPINDRSKLTMAAAFAASMMSATTIHAGTSAAEPITLGSTSETQVQPSPAALQRLEEAVNLAWFPWPLPPKFIELWPELIHVESIYPA